MALSSDLVSQFVKITKDNNKTSNESTLYGTVVEYDGSLYVRLDGSDLLTPVSTTTDMVAGERVTVLVKDHTATVTGNVTSPSARTDDVKDLGDKVSDLNVVVADKVSTGELEATNAKIENLEADNATIKDTLTANKADISDLQADNVTIKDKLTANTAVIENLDAKYATITQLDAEHARIDSLEADVAKIDNLEADVADIETLIFGSASGDVIQSSFSNAVVAQIGEAQIESAMIKSLSASKITAGDIYTNNVRVLSEDGSLIISDETIQISDDTRVRVQIGKDAANDYSINIWDASGKLMFSEGGITDSAIKQAIIRNDMVSETANISAAKLDINSLFEEINDSSNTIYSTRIYLNDEEQTLDVAFKSMTTTVDDISETVTSQGTQISTIQGQITSKVWQEDINTAIGDNDTEIETLKTQYSELDQQLDSIALTVANHTTELEGKADDKDVTMVRDQVSSLELDLTGFKTLVSDTYATKDSLNSVTERVTTAESSIEQNTQQIALRVTQTELIEATDEVREELSEQSASITADCEGIILTALESYVETSNYDEFKQTVESQLTLLADEMTLKFTETNEQLETTNNDLQGQIDTITKYFTFDVNGMTIGASDNPNKVVIDNDHISILVNDAIVQEFNANGKSIIPDLDVTTSLKALGYLIGLDGSNNLNCEFVGATLRILREPQDTTAVAGEQVTFTIAADGDGVTYQWRYKHPDNSYWYNSEDATTDTYTVTADDNEGFMVRCIVYDEYGNSVKSRIATIYVVEPEPETETETETEV